MNLSWENFVIYFNNLFTGGLLWDFSVKIIESIVVLVIGKLVIKIGNKFIDNLVRSKKKDGNDRRKNTLIMLLKSIMRYGVYFFAAMIVLSIFNVPIASLLAGAGIIGLGIGFGSQNLVKDIINGFFILFEDQFGVGDYIKAAGVEGLVEEIGLRTTSIRNFGGELHIIPNGEINQVTNYSTGNMRVMVDVGVAYEEDPAHVIEVLENLCAEIAQEKGEFITDGPTVLGVNELASSSVVIRILARVLPMEQWQIARYIRRRIKERLDELGIEIAYPHMVLLSKGKEAESGLEKELT
jgi:moderate conductance mechanosensitive channel